MTDPLDPLNTPAIDPVEARLVRIEALTASASSLKSKIPAIKDPEILDALKGKLKQVEDELAELQREDDRAIEDEAPVVPPTSEQLEAADRLIALSRVEKMRGNAAKASDYLKEAAAAAPTAPSVLEAVGDDYRERGQAKAAQDMYRQAVKLDPSNVGLERKFAETVLRTTPSMSVEQQLAMGLGSGLGNDIEVVAGARAATFLTIFAPGLGHIVMGQTVKGGIILTAWVAALVWLFSDQHALKPVLHGQYDSKSFSTVLIPAAVAATIHVFAIMGCLNRLKQPSARNRPNRPLPPVNLPFD